jgi:ADP-heptose:LPS heptosyltransferase
LWPEENFAALADGIVDRLPVQVFIFQSPGEEATAAGVYNRMQRRLQAVLIPPLSLRRYASLVSVCRVFVAHDRGPMHIAASLGPAVVGVFTSRQAPYWFPYSEREGHVYFQKDQVSHITVKEVLTACRSLLGRGDVRQPGGTEGK